jgi:hypothetical protein
MIFPGEMKTILLNIMCAKGTRLKEKLKRSANLKFKILSNSNQCKRMENNKMNVKLHRWKEFILI